MKNYVLLLSLCIFSIPAIAQVPAWTNLEDGTGQKLMFTSDVDDLGNVYVTTRGRDSLHFSDGVLDTFIDVGSYQTTSIYKLNPAGLIEWIRILPSSVLSSSDPYGIRVDSRGNVYIAGWFRGTVDFNPGPGTNTLSCAFNANESFLLKLDSNGDFVWVRHFDGNRVFLGNLYLRDDNKIIIHGFFDGSVNVNPSGTAQYISSPDYEALLMELDSNGVVNNYERMKSTVNAGFADIEYSDDHYYVSGPFEGVIDVDFASTSTHNLTSRGSSQDVFVAKYDTLWGLEWVKHIAGDNQVVYGDLEIGPAGNIHLAGSSNGACYFNYPQNDFFLSPISSVTRGFVAQWNPKGDLYWVNVLGDAGFVSTQEMVIGKDGMMYLLGTATSNTDLNPDTSAVYRIDSNSTALAVYLLKLRVDGSFVGVSTLPTPSAGNAMLANVLLDPFNNMFITLSFSSSINMSLDPATPVQLTVPGIQGAVVAKYNQCEPPVSISRPVACDSVQVENNFVYQSRAYVFTRTHPLCDSVFIVDATVHHSKQTDIDINSCDTASYQGVLFRADTTIIENLTTINGCDSTHTVSISINYNNARDSVLTVFGCDSLDLGGFRYFQSQSLDTTIADAFTCDSTFTLNVVITTINDSISMTPGTPPIIWANMDSANYQWFYCTDTSVTPIAGETGRYLQSVPFGDNVLVVIEKNGCTDTSDCISPAWFSLSENTQVPVRIFPNPSQDWISVEWDGNIACDEYLILDLRGRVLQEQKLTSQESLNVELPSISGTYLLKLKFDNGTESYYRVVKR